MRFSGYVIFICLFCLIITSSCQDDRVNPTSIPETSLLSKPGFDVYDTVFVLNARPLEEGLKGNWEVLEHNKSYFLSDPSRPDSKIYGKYGGRYLLRWTVTNGVDQRGENFLLRMLREVPEVIIEGGVSHQLYKDTIRMKGVELTEGLSGHWEILENSKSFGISDFKDPKCLFEGELLGMYKLRWVVTNGKDERFEDIDINIVGITDYVNNEKYKAVSIEDQIWLAENLKSIHYANGEVISDGLLVGDLSTHENPKYWFLYDDNLDFLAEYGRLYTWYAVNDPRNICPDGWHLPDNTEWSELVNNLGGDRVAGGKLKEMGSIHWISPNMDATNESGFTALPGGMRGYGGAYGEMGYSGKWWSRTENSPSEGFSWNLSYSNGTIYYGGSNKKVGFSCRCIKD